MLEQLKEIILEMKLLMRDCCNPVMSTTKRSHCDKDDFNEISKDEGYAIKEDTNEHEMLICVDPCFRHIFSATSFSSQGADEGEVQKAKIKGKSCSYKVKSVGIPVYYQTIFIPDMDSDNENIFMDAKTEHPVKFEPHIEEVENGIVVAESTEESNSVSEFVTSKKDNDIQSKITNTKSTMKEV